MCMAPFQFDGDQRTGFLWRLLYISVGIIVIVDHLYRCAQCISFAAQ